jgi:hypothetical protein
MSQTDTLLQQVESKTLHFKNFVILFLNKADLGHRPFWAASDLFTILALTFCVTPFNHELQGKLLFTQNKVVSKRLKHFFS